jgi:sensitive to high expression protein 9
MQLEVIKQQGDLSRSPSCTICEATKCICTMPTYTSSFITCSTELYRGEHKLDAQVAAARDAHEAAIEAVEGAQVALMQAIRERYTEEQMWAEKIRRAATW